MQVVITHILIVLYSFQIIQSQNYFVSLLFIKKYIQTISSTGNSFEVEMQIQQLDENPGVKVTQAEMTKIGENVYYNKYTSQIEEELNKNGKMKLKEGLIFKLFF